jgi:predicted Zn-dependent protease
MVNLKKVSLSILMILFIISLDAKSYPHSEAGVKVNIPDDWSVSGDENHLHAVSPSQTIIFDFEVFDGADANNVKIEAKKFIATELSDVSYSSSFKPATLNGMPATMSEGDGYVNGEKFHFGAYVIKTPKNKSVLLLVFAADATYNSYAKQINGIFSSFKKI